MMGFTNMRSGVFASISAHLLVVVIAQFGLPHLFSEPPVAVTIIPVDLVLDDVNAPPPPATPEPESEPEVAKPPPPPPEPEPEPPAEPEVVEAPPPPPEKPKPPKKEPPKEPEPEKVKPKPSTLAKAQPQSKPKPPKPPKPLRDFADILKDLPPEKTPPKNQTAEAPKDKGEPTPAPPQINDRASVTEIERLKQMIRQQIQPCWSPPVGAAGAEDLAVAIFIRVDQRGFVSEARVIDAQAMARNTFVQAAADAARRAVLNPRCQPFQLPQNRYDLWKEIEFNFDPREMLG
jgi:outer membrane biosynthesis protein TonB